MNDLVPVAVAADGAIGGECPQEVLIKLISRDRDEPAQTRQTLSFLVDKAVPPFPVVGDEDNVEMIRDLLVSKLREAARASRSGHVSTSFLGVSFGRMD
jgi:hypothetical protein